MQSAIEPTSTPPKLPDLKHQSCYKFTELGDIHYLAASVELEHQTATVPDTLVEIICPDGLELVNDSASHHNLWNRINGQIRAKSIDMYHALVNATNPNLRLSRVKTSGSSYDSIIEQAATLVPAKYSRKVSLVVFKMDCAGNYITESFIAEVNSMLDSNHIMVILVASSSSCVSSSPMDRVYVHCINDLSVGELETQLEELERTASLGIFSGPSQIMHDLKLSLLDEDMQELTRREFPTATHHSDLKLEYTGKLQCHIKNLVLRIQYRNVDLKPISLRIEIPLVIRKLSDVFDISLKPALFESLFMSILNDFTRLPDELQGIFLKDVLEGKIPCMVMDPKQVFAVSSTLLSNPKAQDYRYTILKLQSASRLLVQDVKICVFGHIQNLLRTFGTKLPDAASQLLRARSATASDLYQLSPFVL